MSETKPRYTTDTLIDWAEGRIAELKAEITRLNAEIDSLKAQLPEVDPLDVDRAEREERND